MADNKKKRNKLNLVGKLGDSVIDELKVMKQAYNYLTKSDKPKLTKKQLRNNQGGKFLKGECIPSSEIRKGKKKGMSSVDDVTYRDDFKMLKRTHGD